MNCLLKFAAIYLCITQIFCQVWDPKEAGKCRYYNDPHLIPFPSSPGAGQDQYICRNNCTEILLKNDFVEIIVTPDPSGDYPIVAYTLIFFATDSYPFPCVITNSIANPSTSLTCPINTPASTILTGSGQFHTHLTENIQVDITTRGAHFNIEVTQSFDLIYKSEGICIKWDCEFEKSIGNRRKRHELVDPLILEICDLFINAGMKYSTSELSKDYFDKLNTSCVYDTDTTYDFTYAQSLVVSILREIAKQSQNPKDLNDALKQADANAETVILKTQEAVNKLIESRPEVCKKKDDQYVCLKPYFGTS